MRSRTVPPVASSERSARKTAPSVSRASFSAASRILPSASLPVSSARAAAVCAKHGTTSSTGAGRFFYRPADTPPPSPR